MTARRIWTSARTSVAADLLAFVATLLVAGTFLAVPIFVSLIRAALEIELFFDSVFALWVRGN
jgi:hypothetical protein